MSKLNSFISKLDKFPLWFIGILLQIIVFAPYVIMKEASVFVWHDQLDMLSDCVIWAKHFGDGLDIYPEMMCGIQAVDFLPNSQLFAPFYIWFTPFVAFVLSYAIVFAMAFYGMYLLIKELTGSSIISLICAGCFAMLPFYPIYGGAVAGVPLCAYGIVCLSRNKNILASYVCLLLYTTTSQLVLSGYAVLGLWALWILYEIIRKQINRYSLYGFFGMIVTYIVINISLFKDMLFGDGSFISQRSEFINTGEPVLKNIWSVFTEGGMHADSFHIYLIIPVIVMLAMGLIWRRRLAAAKIRLLNIALAEFICILLICILFGILNSETIANWKNTQDNILRNFELDRFYWLLPAMWYSLLGLCIGVWWREDKMEWLRLIIVCLMVIPTALLVKDNSLFYMSVNQMNNGSGITGYISWEAYYSDDVFEDIEDAIGKDMSTYRVAHLGICPAPALMHGFYTVDGYASNYSLEYKHTFREIIADELEITPEAKAYFDNWGSRCYLFNSQTGTSYMVGKSANATYEDLKIDWDKLSEMGCEYIFSCGEILDAKDCGLKLIGNFTSDTSYWNIWVYELTADD